MIDIKEAVKQAEIRLEHSKGEHSYWESVYENAHANILEFALLVQTREKELSALRLVESLLDDKMIRDHS